MAFIRRTLLVLAGLSLTASAHAQSAPTETLPWFGAEFSADIIMSSPRDPSNKAQGKLFVGNKMIRAQGEHRGELKTVIINHNTKKAFTLLDSAKQYHDGIGQAPMPPPPDLDVLPSDADSGCNVDKGPICKQEGKEKINGVDTDKWVVTITSPQGQKIVTALWVDPKRSIVIRQQPQEGPVMNRVLAGTEQIDGRTVEKWEFDTSFKDQSQKSTQWVDPKLRAPVRIALGGGVAMEMKNIKEGPQPAALFAAPADYQLVQPKAPTPPQGGALRPMPQGGAPQAAPAPK